MSFLQLHLTLSPKVEDSTKEEDSTFKRLCILLILGTEGENQTLVGAIPYCGEYPGPRFEDKFRSANQMDGISKADEIKWRQLFCKQENIRNTV